ncbi:MAG: hypothetical protein ACK5HT_15795 [Draconibacterium sp.]
MIQLKNNFIINFRSLKADKTNSLINLVGLVLGLAVVIVALVFVVNELSYDHGFANRNQIYRVCLC